MDEFTLYRAKRGHLQDYEVDYTHEMLRCYNHIQLLDSDWFSMIRDYSEFHNVIRIDKDQG